jgi:hypothetical protein
LFPEIVKNTSKNHILKNMAPKMMKPILVDFLGVDLKHMGVKHALSISNHEHEHHLAYIITCNISVTLS